MNNSKNVSQHSSTELTREELADVAYMCYILDRTQTTRWYHKWRISLDKMVREGWTMKGLYYRGMVRQKIEQIYGLSPFHSRRAVKAYPPVNLGLEPWQDLTDECVNDLAGQIYREYVGLPPQGGYAFSFDAWREDEESPEGQVDASDPGQDCFDNNGGFFFI